jgi:transcriptional regulator GlxA family with amidase domain
MPMKIAYVIFDGITWLDLIGVYDPVSRLKSMGYIKDLEWEFCSKTKMATDHFGLSMVATKVDETLDGFDVLVIPGGYGTRQLVGDQIFLEWIRTAGPAKYKISICTGSLILGAAGFLKGLKATTHFAEYETLKPFCKEVITDRIVEDGNTITAGAVTSGIDLGLFLCEKWSGEAAATAIRGRMDYRG